MAENCWNNAPTEIPLAKLINEAPMIPRSMFPLLLVCFISQPIAGEETPRPRIEAEGVKGTLLLCGSPNDAALDRFLEAAGGAKATLVLLRTACDDRAEKMLGQRLLERWTGKAAGVAEMVISPESVHQLVKATGVWFCGTDAAELRRVLPGTTIERSCQSLLNRGGALGASGNSARLIGSGAGFLPNALLDVQSENGDSSLAAELKRDGALVGYTIAPDAALIVRGRRLSVVGDGKVVIHLAASPARPARQIVLGKRDVEDLTALRRSALARSQPPFPPAKLPMPVVEKGTLIIIGGGGMPAGLFGKFVALAGGPKASIVVFPTAMPDPLPARDPAAAALERLGAGKVTVLKARTQAEVESEEFLDALRNATGIWFGGGRQWMFVDAYEGTKAHAEMFALLKRGGVIAGSSAGATIQGDYLCRGGVFGNFEIMYEGYERGLGFLPGVGIDQHFTQRKRFGDMTAFVKRYPQYLGIGIDEATAIIVKGSVAEVTGRGKVHFYDAARPVEKGKPDYEAITSAGRYDLKARKSMPAVPK
jgi:cyanophycinase